ncbi:MAG: cysteine desulfurase family protein [Smithellaceae bacterium]|nr:cysteine desulfurase family protein [Smithellaceae bacterium]
MQTIYLDHISGTPLHPRVKEVIINHLEENYGNPISQHRVGDAALEALNMARAQVAGLINAKESEIVFTSGGTESVNQAIKGIGLLAGKKKGHIITSNIEHQAVQKSLRMLVKQGIRVTSLPVDKYGLVDPAEVEKAISEDTILVTIMHANNEIGTIEPIAEIGKITRSRGIVFHTDAVASIGVIPFDVDELGVDLASLAANQFYGPPGIGALYIRSKTKIKPLIEGGIQENGQRAGTENMIGIVGMGKAAELAKKEMPARTEHLLRLKKAFIAGLETIDEIIINGHPVQCLPHLLSFSVQYVEGEAMVVLMDEKGVCLSTRSACATGSLRASHVLIATGCEYTTAQGTLIFSCGIANTLEEVEKTIEYLKTSIAFLRNMSPIYKGKK